MSGGGSRGAGPGPRLHSTRAEDRSGAFGIAPGHANFITLLPVSVVTWREANGKEGFVLVRGGVLLHDYQHVRSTSKPPS